MKEMIPLKENTGKKVAMVTGGGSGLGLAIARKFSELGMETVIVGRDREKLQNAAGETGCQFRVCDLSDLGSIPALVEEVIGTYGRIDVLVNNAGINQKKAFTEVTDEEFQRILTTNVCAVFSLSREVVKHMQQAGSGVIINISSMAAQYGIPRVIAYSASKSAIDGMTHAMAVELAPLGIRVNAIAPGFIYSDMTARALDSDPERKAKVFSRTPMGKMGQPEDIAEAAAYLAGEGSRYVTGVILPVDGGNSIGF